MEYYAAIKKTKLAIPDLEGVLRLPPKTSLSDEKSKMHKTVYVIL